MTIVENFLTRFWDPYIWLPENVTWADVEPGNRPGIVHTNYRHLIYPIPMAFVFMILRLFIEKYWIAPIGRSLGIKSQRTKRATPNPILEAAYNQSSKLHHKAVLALTKQCDMTERQIQRWWRYRRAQDKPPTLVKFCECSWRCLYYTCIFIYGLYILWDKSWFWNVRYCWLDNYPHQSLTNDVWWYYMISMAFYWSLTFTQFIDVKRKDFWQMFAHHIITILLLTLSWIYNCYRFGSLILIVHDCADIFLEIAKLTKYATYQKVCDATFAFFTVIWIATRLGYFPRILYGIIVEAPQDIPVFPAYYIFSTLLSLLLCLHIGWTYLILKIAHRAIKFGEMQGDIRSDSSDFSDSSEKASTTAANGTPKKMISGNSSATNSPRKLKTKSS